MIGGWIGLFESFAAAPFGGNPAGVVVTDAWPSAREMLGLASTLAAPTTGFLARESLSDTHAEVRFFTPTQEIDACGHVSIAIAQALHDLELWSGGEPTELVCRHSRFAIEANETGFAMSQTVRQVRAPSSTYAEVSQVLGVPVQSVATASTGLSHLFVELHTVANLARMTVDHDDLVSLGRRNNIDTVGVYATISSERVRLRDFTAPIGDTEEPASGTTSGALGSLIGRPKLVIEQGVEMGRPSELLVAVGSGEVVVSGSSRRVFSGRMD